MLDVVQESNKNDAYQMRPMTTNAVAIPFRYISNSYSQNHDLFFIHIRIEKEKCIVAIDIPRCREIM